MGGAKIRLPPPLPWPVSALILAKKLVSKSVPDRLMVKHDNDQRYRRKRRSTGTVPRRQRALTAIRETSSRPAAPGRMLAGSFGSDCSVGL